MYCWATHKSDIVKTYFNFSWSNDSRKIISSDASVGVLSVKHEKGIIHYDLQVMNSHEIRGLDNLETVYFQGLSLFKF